MVHSIQAQEILLWMSPEPYIQHHEQTKQDVLPGTGQWLLSDPKSLREGIRPCLDMVPTFNALRKKLGLIFLDIGGREETPFKNQPDPFKQAFLLHHSVARCFAL